MDKGDVIQNIKKRFVDFKERQHDMHSIFMNRYNTIQAKENADISAARKIMNSNQNNKAAKPKQQFVPKQLGSASNEQSNTVNTVNGTSFTNGPSDMMQVAICFCLYSVVIVVKASIKTFKIFLNIQNFV